MMSAFLMHKNPFPTLILVFLISLTLAPAYSQSADNHLKAVYSNEKKLYGYIDSISGKLVIPYKFDEAKRFHKGLAVIVKDHDPAIINTSGKTVYSCKHCTIDPYYPLDIFLMQEFKTFRNGVLNSGFEMVIPYEYNEINPAGHVLIVKKEAVINGSPKWVYGIYDNKMKLVVPCELSEIPDKDKSGNLHGGGVGKSGVISNTGEIIIPFNNRQIDFEPGIMQYEVQNMAGAWELYSTAGKQLSSFGFEAIYPVCDGFLPVQLNGKWGFYRNGKIVIPCLHDQRYPYTFKNGLVILSRDYKNGICDTLGNEVVPFKYTSIKYYGKDMYITRIQDNYGLLDAKGKEILPCEFAGIPEKPLNGHYILQNKDQKYGCVNQKGQVVVPFVVDETYAVSNYKSAAGYLDKMLSVDPKNQEIAYLAAYAKKKNAKPEDALPYVNQIFAKYHRDSIPRRLYYVRAMIYADLNDFENADNDAFYSIKEGTPWISQSYIYLGNVKFARNDLKAAEQYYWKASLYHNSSAAEGKLLQQTVIAEMKKRGIYEEPAKLELGVKKEYVADIPTTIRGFATQDYFDYAGNYEFKHVYTYEEALKNCPAGFRLPTVDDWVGLFEQIMSEKGISSSRAYDVVSYLGTGWDQRYSVQEGFLQDSHTYTYYSDNSYNLNISPINTYTNRRDDDSRYEFDYSIVYWIQQGYYEREEVNVIMITKDGFRFRYLKDGGKACLRYVKNKK